MLTNSTNDLRTPITDQERRALHTAGLGMYRPQGAGPIARCDALVSAGLLGRNPRTGIYFLTAAGNDVLRGL